MLLLALVAATFETIPAQAKIRPATVKLIAEFEGFYPCPYNDPVGHATIGYGHLLHYGNVTKKDRRDWGCLRGGEGISEKRGRKLLRRSLKVYDQAVSREIEVPINRFMRTALTSFAYNLGTGIFDGSKLKRIINAGRYKGVPRQIRRFVHARNEKGKLIVLEGLVRRRNREARIFRTSDKICNREGKCFKIDIIPSA